MLGAFLMILLAGVLAYVFCVCVIASRLGGGEDLGVFAIAVFCVVAFIALLFFAPEIVNMRIRISF